MLCPGLVICEYVHGLVWGNGQQAGKPSFPGSSSQGPRYQIVDDADEEALEMVATKPMAAAKVRD